MIRWLGLLALLGWGALPVSGQTPGPVGIGLAPVNDWSTQQPFIDVMKTARRWIGHRPGQWGGMDFDQLEALGILDDQGWPMQIPTGLGAIGTLVLTDLPAQATAYAGRYVLEFDGQGIVEVAGSARNKRYGSGRVAFDFEPGNGPVDIRIQRSGTRGGDGDYIRNISIIREDLKAEYDAGAMFNPLWLKQLEGFGALRFMDWMNTNNSDQGDWAARPRDTDFSYTWRGVPLGIMLDLANQTGTDPWFNMPHLADDAYMSAFAAQVEAGLNPDRRVYVEYSNEVWNWQFLQAEWADAQGRDLWGEIHKGAQFYGMRAAEMARIWAGAFAQRRAALVTVIATQTGWLGLEADILNAPLHVANGGAPPVQAFDAYGVAGYFGHVLGTEKRAPMIRSWIEQSRAAAADAGTQAGLKDAALATYIEAHRYDQAFERAAQELRDGTLSGDSADTLADLRQRVFPYHAEVAARHGLDLITYEGGSHVVGIGVQVDDADLTDFYTALNYAPQMGPLYDGLIGAWRAVGGGLFTAYADVMAPSKWGSWGTLRYLGDDTSRMRALRQWQ